MKSAEIFFCIFRSEFLSGSANRISTPTLRAPISRNLSSNCAIRYRGHGHCPYCARLFVSISTITILLDAARPERDLSRLSYILRSSVESRRGWNKYKKATTQVNAIPQRIMRACSFSFGSTGHRKIVVVKRALWLAILQRLQLCDYVVLSHCPPLEQQDPAFRDI